VPIPPLPLPLIPQDLTIRWQQSEYTVREDEGSLEVCAELIGTHSTTIAFSNIMLRAGTAMEGIGKTGNYMI
jgi:hypothetical protein